MQEDSEPKVFENSSFRRTKFGEYREISLEIFKCSFLATNSTGADGFIFTISSSDTYTCSNILTSPYVMIQIFEFSVCLLDYLYTSYIHCHHKEDFTTVQKVKKKYPNFNKGCRNFGENKKK